MKFYMLATVAVICLVAMAWFPKTSLFKKTAIEKIEIQNIKREVAEAWQFVKENDYNTEKCFLIEMNKPSGSQRFYIYDFKKDTITNAGLVAHGNCFEYWLEGRKYSNVVGSGCTSLGKYKIGASYSGKWGYSYKLQQ
jgi:hypothetical protein